MSSQSSLMTSPTLLQRGAELGAPLLAIAYACLAQGLPFYSAVPVVIVTMFGVVQAALRYFLFDSMKDFFIASGKVTQYWTTLGIAYGFIGLGMVQLFLLITAQPPAP
jgi:hypothetical protein